MMDNTLPIHDFSRATDDIVLEKIAHKNPYDFTQKHRHSYFEILFFEKGGGTQLIDFIEYEVQDNSCYIIFPKQIHLLKRSADSRGELIQFKEESIDNSIQRTLSNFLWNGRALVFENDRALFDQSMEYLKLIERESSEKSSHSRTVCAHLLHALLYRISAIDEKNTVSTQSNSDYQLFLQLLEEHHSTEHSVSFYLSKMTVNEKKLGMLTKQHLGQSPLQVIHSRLILEAKRLLLFGDMSHKEIAFDLGFDSPASFSAFVKKKTGRTATELQGDVAEIHN